MKKRRWDSNLLPLKTNLNMADYEINLLPRH